MTVDIPNAVEQHMRNAARGAFDESKKMTRSTSANTTDILELQSAAIDDLTNDDTDFTLLGNGAGRVVVTHPSFDGFVVKIATYSPREKQGFSLDGVTQNTTEAWTWDHAPDSFRDRLTPVCNVLGDGRLLVMPIVETDPDEIPYDEAEAFVEETLEAVHREDWYAVELDVNVVGRRDGALEVFDYGLPIKPRTDLLEESDYLASLDSLLQ